MLQTLVTFRVQMDRGMWCCGLPAVSRVVARVVRAAIMILSSLSLAACTTLRPLPSDGTLPADLSHGIRLTLASGETIHLRRPFIEGDSAYVGMAGRNGLQRIPFREVVAAVEPVPRDPPLIVAIPLSLVLVGGMAAALLCCRQDGR